MNTVKKWLIWSFGRGSFQYDVLCGLILIVIILVPSSIFDDRPDYMRLPDLGVRRAMDDQGNTVYAVRVRGAVLGLASEALESEARESLEAFLRSAEPVRIDRVEPVENTFGGVSGYAFWVGPEE